MSPDGGRPVVGRRNIIAAFWAERRARWTLPLVIIVVIIVVALVDHIGAHRISEVDRGNVSSLVSAKGGTATVVLDRPWQGFNPGTPGGATSSTPTLLQPVLPSAFTVTPGLRTTLNHDLLDSVEVTSTVPLTIRYVLNPKAVWSDGVPVSAADFIYAWQSQRGNGVSVHKHPDAVASTIGYRDIASVTGDNNGKTVTVVFSRPFTDWRVLFDEMVPAHIAQRVGWNHGFATFSPARVLSAGPMMLQSVSAAGTAVLVRNPAWWGTKAVLDQVTVSVSTDPSSWTHTLATNSGAVVQASRLDLGALGAISSLPNAQSSIAPSLRFLQLEFNVTAPTTAPMAVRQAIAHAVNRQSLIDQTFGAIDPTLTASNDHLAVNSQPGYTASTASTEYDTVDLGATDRLLKSAGYSKALDGRYVDASGNPLTVRMAVETGDPWVDGVALGIVSQLRQAGITVVTVPVNGRSNLAIAANTGAYDMALVTARSSPFPTATAGWYSNRFGAAGAPGSQNWSNFDDPQVDQLFSEGARQLNPVSGAAYYAQIDDELWDQMVALPLVQEPTIVAHGVQIANVRYNPSDDGLLWNVQFWTTLKPTTPAQKG